MLEGRRVPAIMVQKHLNDRDLGTQGRRWLMLERKNTERAIELSAERAAFPEKRNPCFRERHVKCTQPDELLCQDAFLVGSLKGLGEVYLHAVVDTYGSCAFDFLHVSKQLEAAVAAMHNDVLVFYRRTRVRTPRTSGFAERFIGTVLDEFFRVKMREKVYATVEALQDDVDTWDHPYNRERPHLGYGNQGRRPWYTVQMFVSKEARKTV